VLTCGVLVLGVGATGLVLSPAAGDQNDIDRVSAQVSDLEYRAAAAGERANGARLAVHKAQAQLVVVEARLARARESLDLQRVSLTKLVRQLYVNGGMDGALLSFTLDDPSDLLVQLDVLSAASSSQTGIVDAARAAALELQRSEARVQEEKDRLAAAAADLSAQEQAARDSLGEAQSLLASLKEEERRRIAAIEEAKRQAAMAAARRAAAALAAQRAEEARAAQAEAARQQAAAAARDAADQQAAAQAQREAQDAAAAAAADAAAAAADAAAEEAASTTDAPADTGGDNGPSSDTGEMPAANPGGYGNGSVSDVIDFALAQVGKAYVWGAEGPDSFDCSGLTMMAWRQAGVSISHYSGSQYDETQKVSTDSLQPGDLLYFYAISEHVGIYIGNGEFVHAANPGVGVVHASLDDYWRSNLVAASRPG
jgi:cell wall-associated NlpC family hydrolase